MATEPSQPMLTTARLRLRPFVAGDAATVQRLAGERAIADTTLAIPHPYADGMAESWIERHAPAFAAGELAVFAIVRADDEALVGAVSLVLHPQHSNAELAYWVGVPYWNNGYATEASRTLIAYGFDELRLHRIYAVHLVRNPASGRVMQKLGMQHEGRLRSHVRKWDQFEDVDYYGLLAEEWRRGTPATR